MICPSLDRLARTTTTRGFQVRTFCLLINTCNACRQLHFVESCNCLSGCKLHMLTDVYAVFVIFWRNLYHTCPYIYEFECSGFVPSTWRNLAPNAMRARRGICEICIGQWVIAMFPPPLRRRGRLRCFRILPQKVLNESQREGEMGRARLEWMWQYTIYITVCHLSTDSSLL